MSVPRIGDEWVIIDDGGAEVRAKVTATIPPDPAAGHFEWRISLDGGPVSHVGWFYGQGWSDGVEESERPTASPASPRPR